jgi:hypothetical protein
MERLDILFYCALIARIMDLSLTTLSAAQLRRAAEIKEQIESLQGELSALAGGAAPAVTSAAPAGRRTMSLAAIARIRAAQKARWAAHRSAKANAAAGALTPQSQAKRPMSMAARARLAAIARARWAKIRAQGRNAL